MNALFVWFCLISHLYVCINYEICNSNFFFLLRAEKRNLTLYILDAPHDSLKARVKKESVLYDSAYNRFNMSKSANISVKRTLRNR